jgi:hypothetical protein
MMADLKRIKLLFKEKHNQQTVATVREEFNGTKQM